MYWFGKYLDPVTLTYISRSSDFYTFCIDVSLSLGCIIRKVSAEDVAIRGIGTGLEYMCPTRHFIVYIFFNPVFQLSTAKNEINLFNNHVLIVAPVTFAPAGATTPSAEFLLTSPTLLGNLSWNLHCSNSMTSRSKIAEIVAIINPRWLDISLQTTRRIMSKHDGATDLPVDIKITKIMLIGNAKWPPQLPSWKSVFDIYSWIIGFELKFTL